MTASLRRDRVLIQKIQMCEDAIERAEGAGERQRAQELREELRKICGGFWKHSEGKTGFLVEGLQVDGSQAIVAEVVPSEGGELQLWGECVVKQAEWHSTCDVSVQSMQCVWAAQQLFDSDSERSAWCSPFLGLFGQLQHMLRTGFLLSCSKHSPGATSEELTPEGLLCGHEYGVTGVAAVAGHRLVKLQNPHGHGIHANDDLMTS